MEAAAPDLGEAAERSGAERPQEAPATLMSSVRQGRD
jgi:hypothetical protein